MQTKIAVICSASFQEVLEAIVPSTSPFLLDYYTYSVPEETPHLLKKLKSCDVVLLSGTLPYLYAKDFLDDLTVPWMYLKQDESSIATTLLSLLVQKSISLQRLSVDVMDNRFIEQVLNDIQTAEQPYIQTIDLHTPYEQYIRQHEQLWQLKKIDYVITSIHAVHDALAQKGIPVLRMMDPPSSVLRGLYEAKSLSDYAKSDSAKVAIVNMTFEQQPTDALLEQIATLLASFYQKIDVLSYEFYTTNGQLQSQLSALLALLQTSDYIGGCGYGQSITQARIHAKQALTFAQHKQLILVDDNKQLHELHIKMPTAIALQTTNPLIFEITQATGLSPKNISRIVAFQQLHAHSTFTAQDLADYLQVTRRTTERILKKLLTHHYVKVVGEEMAYQQGRPRAVYELNFPY